jgi:hypothetical protein
MLSLLQIMTFFTKFFDKEIPIFYTNQKENLVILVELFLT